MNRDETNSPADPNPAMEAWIAPELEARVVAWVAGEASAFERAELERLVAEKPELAIFKRRIETVDGLVNEAARPDRAPLRLAEERRAKLLQVLGTTPAGASAPRPADGKVVALPEAGKRPRWSWRGRQIYFAVSGMAAAAVVAIVTLPWSTDRKDHGVARISDAREEKLRDSDSAVLLREPAYLLPRPTGAEASAAPPAPAEETLQLSPFMVERKPTLLEKLKRSMVGEKKPARPAPDQTLASAEPPPAASRAHEAPAMTVRAAAPSLPAPRDDTIVKMDAFTVPAEREGYVAARSSSATLPPAVPRIAQQSLLGPGPTHDIAAPVAVDLLAGNSLTDALPTTPSPEVTTPTFRAQIFSDTAGGVVSADKKQRDGSTFGSAGGLVLGASVTGGEATGKLSGSLTLAERKNAESDRPRPRSEAPPTNDSLRAEVTAAAQPESTFSLHVSDVSFRLAHAALLRGESPDASRIRPEEFYNAFDYGDPVPTMAEKVGARIEQAAHPFLQQRNLLRIAVKVPATGRGAGQPLRLTVLLDTSGSMEREDRAASVQRALQALIALLGPNDRITLIGFARQPRLLAEAVAGNQAAQLVDLIARTPAEGGTNLEEALKLGGELALRHRLAGAQNRIVLLTDGAANLGDAEPERLAQRVEGFRSQAIAFDACGVGLDGLDDAVLEALARKGDGRYTVLNSPEEADAGFARKLAGALRPAAENVKLQVRFNAARVGRYRLVGFEQHRLRAEDFRNDQVDAAELAAEEAAVAVYQVETLPQGTGEIGDVFVRFRDAATGQMVERSWLIGYDAKAPAFDRAAPALQLAGTAALLAEKLRGGAPADPIKLSELAPVMNALRGHYGTQPRVQELATMFAAARRLHRE